MRSNQVANWTTNILWMRQQALRRAAWITGSEQRDAAAADIAPRDTP